MNHSNAILVLSCDTYADAWKPFFTFFERYWPDCPFPVYLGTNEKSFSYPKVKQIFSHRKTTWTDELKVILEQIPEQYITLILEDYFIYKPVNTAQITDCLQVMESKKAAYLKLAAFPSKYDSHWPHTQLADNKSIGEIKKNSLYRVCLQTAIWDKQILLQLLKGNENPWEFELEASKRSDNFKESFLTLLSDPHEKDVHGPITYCCTAITAGKWTRGSLKLCQKENIPIDLSSRPAETAWEELVRKTYISLPLNMRKVADYLANKYKRLTHGSK